MTRKELEAKFAELIPQQDLAKMLGVEIQTLIAWNRDGYKGHRLPKVKIGQKTYYRPEDVDRFSQVVFGGGK